MAEEQIDFYDENMTRLGQVSKASAHREGFWHSSIHCWIVRSSNPGFVLFQKRAADKDLYPNMLDISAAGHYQAGEKPEDGVREIVEELGIDVDFSALISLGIKLDVAHVGTVLNREFCRAFLLLDDRLPAEYVPDPVEVTGLVQVAIPDGLSLWSGESERVSASGIEWSAETSSWVPIEMEVTADLFIPRVDPYYYKIFIMAERLLSGSKQLAI